MLMSVEKIIKQVWYKKKSEQKLVTIPKKSDIKAGDYVLIKKIEVEDG